MLVLALSFVASPALARPVAGVWVPLADGTAVCVSRVPDGTSIKGKDKLAFDSLVSELASGAEVAIPAGDDPAWRSLAVAVALRSGTPDVAGAVALADAWPGDPCVAAAAATTIAAAEGRRADPEVITRYVGRAWLAVPHPELARLLAGALLGEGEVERATRILDTWIPLAPGYPELGSMRAEAAMASGDTAAGLDALFALHRAGDRSRDGALGTALYRAGRVDDWLVVAAGSGAPLAGAAEEVATASEPLAALRAHLGLTTPEAKLVALIETSMGLVTCELATDQAPVTVANFWGLATGEQPWSSPDSGRPGSGSLYEGTRFHRVIPGFMVQGGDPLGTGEGGPGYTFADETTPGLGFDRRGRLAMANSGPATNGSQFFVTLGPTPHLNGKHTIFGDCASFDVLDRIAAAPRGASDQPVSPITIDRITFEVR